MNLFGIIAKAAEGTAATAGAAGDPTAVGGVGAMIASFAPMLLIILVFYFMLIRPQRKREKETRAMLAALKVGDKIVTIGGICGKIVKIKDTYVFIETGNIGTETEKSVIKMERDAIKSVEKKITN